MDNGNEFAQHARVAKALQAKVYRYFSCYYLYKILYASIHRIFLNRHLLQKSLAKAFI